MDIFAWLFGALGGLTTATGIGNALKIVPDLGGLTWVFWFSLSAILLLACIAFAIGSQSRAL